jgi:hypothetical protein
VGALDWYEFATYQQRYMGVWHPPEPPGFPEWVLQSDKPLVLDDWTCLEWVFDAANGSEPEAADPRPIGGSTIWPWAPAASAASNPVPGIPVSGNRIGVFSVDYPGFRRQRPVR